MSLIHTEGFDIYGWDGNPNVIDPEWYMYVKELYVGLDVNGGRRGSPCLWFKRASRTNPFYGIARLDLSLERSELFVGYAFKPVAMGGVAASHQPHFGWLYGNTYQCAIYVAATGSIMVYTKNDGSLLGQSAVGVIKTQWQYWELKIVCHATEGSVVIRIDGVEVLNLTDIDTQTAGAGGVTKLHWSNMVDTSGTSYLDDIIVYDDEGSTFNNFQGDLAIVGHPPEEDVDQEWNSTEVNHFEAVNVSGANYDADQIDSSAEGDKDSFRITPDVTYPSVMGLEVAAYGLNDAGGIVKITPFVRIEDTVYYGAQQTMSAGDPDKTSYVWEKNPATGTLWSRSVITAADFGFEVTEIG